MTNHSRHFRQLLAAVAIAGFALAAQPRTAAAQFVVWDPGNFAQAVADQITRVAQYALQGLEYAEAIQGVTHLAEQIRQLDETYDHMYEAARGRIEALGSAFGALSTADFNTFLDADFGSWQSQLTGSSTALVGALENLDGSSLPDFMTAELAAADVVGTSALRSLFGTTNPGPAERLADQWEDGRERGDRIRAADMATAEAAGRVAALLEAAQVDIDGRRGQTELSHTSLQQAAVANQLTAAEMQVALAQLRAIELQQGTLSRHEAELYQRARLEAWVERERAAQDRAADYRASVAGRRAAWRTFGVLVPPQN